MKNNHEFRVPEHHVIWAMERYGEYPVPDRRRWGKDNPSVSFADSSLYTREPLGAVGGIGFRTSDARPYPVCEGAVEKRNFPGEEGWL